MGLHGLPLLSLGYKILPLAASEEIIKVGYANPLIAMSNIGILDVAKLTLDGHEPTDGFMSGAVKYKPYVLLSATSMRKELTMSMCVRGNDEDRRIVDRFFDLYERMIRRPVVCGAHSAAETNIAQKAPRTVYYTAPGLFFIILRYFRFSQCETM